MNVYELKDLQEATARLEAITAQWRGYEGSNPRRYHAELRMAHAAVRVIERDLKSAGLIEYTPHERLTMALDRLFPNTESESVVEHEGVSYRRRYLNTPDGSQGYWVETTYRE